MLQLTSIVAKADNTNTFDISFASENFWKSQNRTTWIGKSSQSLIITSPSSMILFTELYATCIEAIIFILTRLILLSPKDHYLLLYTLPLFTRI